MHLVASGSKSDCGYANGPYGANNGGSAVMQYSVSGLKQIYTHISRVRVDGQISFAEFLEILRTRWWLNEFVI